MTPRYRVRAGDHPWLLATRATGNGARWPELVAANPQKKRAASGNFAMLLPAELLTIPHGWNLPAIVERVDAGAELAPSVSAVDTTTFKDRWGALRAWWTDDDLRAFLRMSERLRMNPADLMLVMASEAGLRPDAMNFSGQPSPVAVGLNQIHKSTAPGLGLSPEYFANQFPRLPVADQLPIVERFYRSVEGFRGARPYPDATSIYLATAAPAHMGLTSDPGGDHVVYRAPSREYFGNVLFDTTKKGWIEVADLGKHLRRILDDPRFARAHAVYSSALARLNSVGEGTPTPGDDGPFMPVVLRSGGGSIARRAAPAAGAGLALVVAVAVAVALSEGS